MKGYLLTERSFVAGEEVFIESRSSENNYAVVFEDDGETGYFYAIEFTGQDDSQRILDALHIYEANEVAPSKKKGIAKIIWSANWLCCALLINNYCQAVFDFAGHGGYCRNAFPPPNDIWTKGDRTLTDGMINEFFG